MDGPLLPQDVPEEGRALNDGARADAASDAGPDGATPQFGALLRSLLPSPRFALLRARTLGLALLLFGIGWLATGIYKVQPDEQGLVLRFGKWAATSGPGLHYHLPAPIETVLLPKITQINQLQLGDESGAGAHTKQMLTGDENIVEADCTLFWQIKDARQYLFNIEDSNAALKIAAEGALREVIGRTPIQAALSGKRQEIADETKVVLQQLLDTEGAGIAITQVQLERVDPPAAVIDAFNDVQRARADQERARNEAEAYRNDLLPHARGEADRIVAEAQAYKTQVVNLAAGEAKSFLAIYESYRRAEDVTAWRLYLDTIDEVLRKAGKVIIDSSGKGVAGIVPYMAIGEPRPAPAAASGASR